MSGCYRGNLFCVCFLFCFFFSILPQLIIKVTVALCPFPSPYVHQRQSLATLFSNYDIYLHVYKWLFPPSFRYNQLAQLTEVRTYHLPVQYVHFDFTHCVLYLLSSFPLTPSSPAPLFLSLIQLLQRIGNFHWSNRGGNLGEVFNWSFCLWLCFHLHFKKYVAFQIPEIFWGSSTQISLFLNSFPAF